MPYVTTRQTPRAHQITLEEILRGEVEVKIPPRNREVTGTVTVFRSEIPAEVLRKADILSMVKELEAFVERHKALYEVERSMLYDTFPIPKKSGGLRWINAPHTPLMEALRELKSLFEDKMFALYHTSAFAYVKGRSTLDAIKKHQANGSKWFAKTDFSDFFGSTTPAFVLDMLQKIFPFQQVMVLHKGREVLSKALDLCFLNGGLPQGTPISPMLTNLMMIPIDHALSKELRKQGFVYTRYADDIQISSRYEFSPSDMVALIDRTLEWFKAPFKIKPSKTRYGSSAGRNWNLGLMLNKDNEITIGYQVKKRFKAMCSNYIMDKKNGIKWDIHDVQCLNGLRSYYKMIEPEYISYVEEHLNRKYSVNLKELIRADLRGDT